MDEHKYDDIINLPHHQSKTRQKMSNYDRAAQFSPFAALTGHSAAIAETARITTRKRELTEDEKYLISEKLRYIAEVLHFDACIVLEYFVADETKDGGSYIKSFCKIARIYENERIVHTSDGKDIRISDIVSIDGDAFNNECEMYGRTHQSKFFDS